MIQSVRVDKNKSGHERWGSSEIYTDGNKFMQSNSELCSTKIITYILARLSQPNFGQMNITSPTPKDLKDTKKDPKKKLFYDFTNLYTVDKFGQSPEPYFEIDPSDTDFKHRFVSDFEKTLTALLARAKTQAAQSPKDVLQSLLVKIPKTLDQDSTSYRFESKSRTPGRAIQEVIDVPIQRIDVKMKITDDEGRCKTIKHKFNPEKIQKQIINKYSKYLTDDKFDTRTIVRQMTNEYSEAIDKIQRTVITVKVPKNFRVWLQDYNDYYQYREEVAEDNLVGEYLDKKLNNEAERVFDRSDPVFDKNAEKVMKASSKGDLHPTCEDDDEEESNDIVDDEVNAESEYINGEEGEEDEEDEEDEDDDDEYDEEEEEDDDSEEDSEKRWEARAKARKHDARKHKNYEEPAEDDVRPSKKGGKGDTRLASDEQGRKVDKNSMYYKQRNMGTNNSRNQSNGKGQKNKEYHDPDRHKDSPTRKYENKEAKQEQNSRIDEETSSDSEREATENNAEGVDSERDHVKKKQKSKARKEQKFGEKVTKSKKKGVLKNKNDNSEEDGGIDNDDKGDEYKRNENKARQSKSHKKKTSNSPAQRKMAKAQDQGSDSEENATPLKIKKSSKSKLKQDTEHEIDSQEENSESVNKMKRKAKKNNSKGRRKDNKNRNSPEGNENESDVNENQNDPNSGISDDENGSTNQNEQVKGRKKTNKSLQKSRDSVNIPSHKKSNPAAKKRNDKHGDADVAGDFADEGKDEYEVENEQQEEEEEEEEEDEDQSEEPSEEKRRPPKRIRSAKIVTTKAKQETVKAHERRSSVRTVKKKKIILREAKPLNQEESKISKDGHKSSTKNGPISNLPEIPKKQVRNINRSPIEGVSTKNQPQKYKQGADGSKFAINTNTLGQPLQGSGLGMRGDFNGIIGIHAGGKGIANTLSVQKSVSGMTPNIKRNLEARAEKSQMSEQAKANTDVHKSRESKYKHTGARGVEGLKDLRRSKTEVVDDIYGSRGDDGHLSADMAEEEKIEEEGEDEQGREETKENAFDFEKFLEDLKQNGKTKTSLIDMLLQAPSVLENDITVKDRAEVNRIPQHLKFESEEYERLFKKIYVWHSDLKTDLQEESEPDQLDELEDSDEGENGQDHDREKRKKEKQSKKEVDEDDEDDD